MVKNGHWIVKKKSTNSCSQIEEWQTVEAEQEHYSSIDGFLDYQIPVTASGVKFLFSRLITKKSTRYTILKILF